MQGQPYARRARSWTSGAGRPCYLQRSQCRGMVEPNTCSYPGSALTWCIDCGNSYRISFPGTRASMFGSFKAEEPCISISLSDIRTGKHWKAWATYSPLCGVAYWVQSVEFPELTYLQTITGKPWHGIGILLGKMCSGLRSVWARICQSILASKRPKP